MADLSVITVGHDHLSHLKKCIPSVFESIGVHALKYTLIDNVSLDGTFEWVSHNFPTVKIIQNKERMGFAENVNQGFSEKESGKYYVLINPDIICSPDVFNNLIEFMDANPKVGVAGPQLLNSDGSVQPSSRGFSTPLAVLVRGLHLDGVFKEFEFLKSYLQRDLSRNQSSEVDWVTGAFMVIRRQAIEDIGLMDQERYFLYSEDQDLCCRMWRGGWKVYYVPSSIATHEHLREGVKKPWSKAARYQWMSTFRMFKKFNWNLSRHISDAD